MSQRNQAGGASGYCGRPSFSESQACLLDVQMCSVGSNKSGSSRLPIVRPIVFAFCRSEKSVVPHWVQKPRRTPDSALNHRSAEHTSELQSLMRISYAVFCLQKKNHTLI